ncbi:MAG: ATP-binding protein [Nitrospirota bacterium]|nr:ATP-binding protein [Nitrospirota bacterium]
MNPAQETPVNFEAALAGALGKLRLMLRRHIHWLRYCWNEVPAERYQGLAISDAEVDRILGDDDVWEQRAIFFRGNSEMVAPELFLASMELSEISTVRLLEQLFLLSAFERDCLLLAAAVELEPGFERLYAYAQDDAGLLLPTPGLALSLFCGNRDEALLNRQAFAPTAPLHRYGLIEWASTGKGGTLTRPFRLDERVLGFLTGRQSTDARIAPVVNMSSGETMSLVGWQGQSDAMVRRIGRFLVDQADQGKRLVIRLRGESDRSRRALADEVCRQVGLPFICARLQDLSGLGLGTAQAIQLFFREALLFSAAACLEVPDEEGVGTQGDVSRQIFRGIADYSSVTFVSSDAPWLSSFLNPPEFNCTLVDIMLPPLDYTMRSRLWEDELATTENGGEISGFATDLATDLANRFRFGAEQISSVMEKARQASVLESRPLMVADIEAACRSLPVHGLENLARKISSPFTWDDIVLPDDALEQIREIAAQFRYRQKVYREWGFEKKMDRGKGICVMFSGPSGTGKTMAAEILANDLGLDLYRIDLSAVVSKYIGETEKNLRRVFDEGEKSQAILFFDEADALFGKRSEVRDSHDRYANIEINYLLQRMESYTGASILATNMRSAIDTAFLRRLRAIVEFPMPDAPHREIIWRKSFPAEAAMNGIDFRFLAKQFTLSGGNIRNAALNAAFMAASGDGCIGMEHVSRAIKREYAKLGKLCTESEFGKYYAS